MRGCITRNLSVSPLNLAVIDSLMDPSDSLPPAPRARAAPVETDKKPGRESSEKIAANRAPENPSPDPHLSDADFYHAFVQLSPDGLWRIGVNPPISIALPEDEQAERLLEQAVILDGNQAFFQMHPGPDGFPVVGKNLGTIFPSENPENRQLMQAIIRSGYHLIGKEFSQTGSHGATRWFLANFLGVIKDDLLQGGWGIQQDITESKRNLHIQAALYKISQATSSAQNLQELYKTIHETLDELMPSDNLFIALHDPAQDLLTFAYFRDQFDPTPQPHKSERGLTEYVLRTGKPALVDPLDFIRLVEMGEVESIGTPSIDWLGVPLVVSNQVIGVLAVQTYTEGVRYSEAERDLLVFVSNQIAMAIDRKRAEESLRINVARFQAIVEDQTELICRLRPGWTISFVNEAFCRYFGRHREELVGKSLINLIPLEARNATLKSFETLTPNNPSATIEHAGIKTGDFSTWEQWITRAIFDDRGQAVEFQRVGRDITERKKFEDELRYLSTHDTLTGIYNRAYFEERVNQLQGGRTTPVSVIIVDVDGLKRINDKFGHVTGDDLLRQAASILRNTFRSEDVVARIGGDEFGVLIPGADEEAAQNGMERIEKALDGHNASPGNILVRLSKGCHTAKKGEEIWEAYRQADLKLLQDKSEHHKTMG